MMDFILYLNEKVFKIMSLYDDTHEGERLSFDDDIIEKKVLYV